jgi:protein tyrosine phosphatase
MVSLQTESKNPGDSYINANYIANPYTGEQKYFIATQGPIPQSMANFWQMVWLEHISAVVMLCGLQEHGRVA